MRSEFDHVKRGCACGHADAEHVDQISFLGSTPATIICRICNMERDIFPVGFLEHERDVDAIREFLAAKLALAHDVVNVDEASRTAYLKLSAEKRRVFDATWRLYLETTRVLAALMDRSEAEQGIPGAPMTIIPDPDAELVERAKRLVADLSDLSIHAPALKRWIAAPMTDIDSEVIAELRRARRAFVDRR